MDYQALRTALQVKRSELPANVIASKSLEISARVWRLPALSRARRLACYFAVNGEVDCQPIITNAWERGREIFLPVLCGEELRFAPYVRGAQFNLNRYGIPEPICSHRHLLQPRQMDVVLTPLVAFDVNGNRLGMGGGYYDRSFRFLIQAQNWTRPRLIGVGYEFQKAAQLKACSWDVPLNKAVTEQQVYDF